MQRPMPCLFRWGAIFGDFVESGRFYPANRIDERYAYWAFSRLIDVLDQPC